LFFVLVFYLPFEQDLAIYLINLNSLYPKIICTKFDWIGLLVLEKKIFKKISVYFYSFAIISPWRRCSPSFEQTWIPSPKDDLCQVCLKLAVWFWRRSQKCKSRQTDGQEDDGQHMIRKAHLSFQLRTKTLHYALRAIMQFPVILYLGDTPSPD
jgi:hypothetical protein